MDRCELYLYCEIKYFFVYYIDLVINVHETIVTCRSNITYAMFNNYIVVWKQTSRFHLTAIVFCFLAVGNENNKRSHILRDILHVDNTGITII